jgi:glycosyltransferase involved in cell wall biosynthesis
MSRPARHIDLVRLLLIGPFGLYPKSTTRARVLPLARALAERGHQVTVLIPPYDHPADAGRRDRIWGVDVIHTPLPGRGAVFARSPLVYLSVAWAAVAATARLLSAQADLVHVFKPKGVAGACFYVALLRRVVSRQERLVLDTDDWEGEGGWNELDRLPWWARALVSFQEDSIIRLAPAVTAASRFLWHRCAAIRRSAAHLCYVPNGYDPRDYPGQHAADGRAIRQQYRLGEAPVVLLYTRFFEFQLPRIVCLWERVHRAVPEARLLVVGGGMFGQDAFLARLLDAAGLSQSARFTGWLQPAQIPSHLAAADVAWFPYDDTLANRAKCSAKLIELMAQRCAIVAEAVGQNPEYIEHGVSGMLVQPGDVDAFAAMTIDLLRDPGARQRLGEAARAMLQERFCWSRLGAEVEALYRDIC